MFRHKIVACTLLLGCALMSAPSFAASWQWQHPGFHGGNGMLNVSVQTRKGVDWAPNAWKGECSGAASNGVDPVGTQLFQGFAVGLHDGGIWGDTYLFANAILCTNANQKNGLAWTVNKFSYQILSIYNQNDQRGSWQMFGDWAPGYYKGECPDGYAVTGLAQTPASNSDISSVLCSKISVAHPTACWTTYNDEFGLSVANDYGNYTFNGQDWNYGYYKTSCWANTYVAGISVDTDHEPIGLLCCQ